MHKKIINNMSLVRELLLKELSYFLVRRSEVRKTVAALVFLLLVRLHHVRALLQRHSLSSKLADT